MFMNDYTSIPEDFKVTKTHERIAVTSNLANPHDEIEDFKVFHTEHGTKFRHWDRAFYRWLKAAKRFKGNNTDEGREHDEE